VPEETAVADQASRRRRRYLSLDRCTKHALREAVAAVRVQQVEVAAVGAKEAEGVEVEAGVPAAGSAARVLVQVQSESEKVTESAQAACRPRFRPHTRWRRAGAPTPPRGASGRSHRNRHQGRDASG
jgi:hypothetical protein